MPVATDLVSMGGALYVTAAKDPLEVDGAAVFKLGASGQLERVLDWDGQGFLRVRRFGPRLLVPDADAPFSLLSFLFDWDVDEYVFVSDSHGAFSTSDRETLPRAYHTFDVARIPDGRLVASTGAYASEEVAYLGKHSPGALFVDDGPERPWRRVLEYPEHLATGVTRLTYLESLGDGTLLAGVQSSLPTLPAAVRITDVTGTPKVTPIEGLQGETLRWAQWNGRVFHLATFDSESELAMSEDGGRSFTVVRSGDLQGLMAAADGLVLLEDGGLVVLRRDGNFEPISDRVVALSGQPSSLVSAPLVVHRGALWAASPESGEIFEAVPNP